MNEKKKLRGNPTVIVALLVFGGFITIFNEVEMNIALPTVSQIYSVPVTTAQWLTTGYMLVAGALMPLAAFVMGRLGSRNTVLFSLSALLVGVLVSLVSSNFEVLLAGRLLQAVCAAFFMPVMFATIMAVAPKDKIGMYNGLAMLVLMAAPAISPTLSGVILSVMGFRWLFTLMLPFLAVALVGTLLFMTDVLDTRKGALDIVSVILSCLGFGGVVFGIGQAAGSGFASPAVLVPLVVGVVSLVFYARRQMSSDHPLLNLRILKHVRYRRSLVFMSILQVVLFGGILVVPLFIQRGWGLTAVEAGLYMLPGGVLTAVGNLLAGMAFDRFGLKTVPFGLLGNAVGYLGVAAAIVMHSPLMLIVFCAIYSGSLPFAMTALTTNSLGCLEKRELPDGSSMNNTLNQIFGSLGTALYTLIMYQLFVPAGTGAAAEAAAISGGALCAMGVSAGISLVAVVAFLMVRRSIDPAGSAQPQQVDESNAPAAAKAA
ncbi:MAG: MFS transporter [Coriobacteriia bacterium]|nr:MFS transporter [Coriobacteriia bacterium]